jgi:hypothetical protein
MASTSEGSEHRTSLVFEWSISTGTWHHITRPLENRTNLKGFKIFLFCIKWSRLVHHLKTGLAFEWLATLFLSIRKLDIYVRFLNG